MRNSEGVEDQLDRLNFALQLVLKGITDGPFHNRNPSSAVSYTTSDAWNEGNVSDNSSSLDLQCGYETKIEELLSDQDRYLMTIEDFLATEIRRQPKLEYSQSELLSLISQLERIKSGECLEIFIGSYNFNVVNTGDSINFSSVARKHDAEYISRLEKEIEDLRKNDSSSAMSSSMEGDEVCALCGVDALRLKKEIKLELEGDFKKRKNEALERERANLDLQLEELDKLKDSYLAKCKELEQNTKSLQRKRIEIEKSELELAKRKSEFERKKKDWENKLLSSTKDFEPPQEKMFSPSKFTEEELQLQLNDLKSQLSGSNDSKIVMKIGQIENQLARYRTEKALSECSKKNSRVLYSLVKTFDKETSQDEHKRKQALDKATKKYQIESTEKIKRQDSSSETQRNKRNEEVAKQMLDKKYELLLQREKELQDKERYLQETWMKVPGAKDLIDVIQVTVDHLNQSKVKNESTLGKLEQDKANFRKVCEKVGEILEQITNPLATSEQLRKVKDQLGALLVTN